MDALVTTAENTTKQEITIVWFKRDLRLYDHEPLFLAQKSDYPVLLLYCFEPSVMTYDDSDVRHWRFIYESLIDMQLKLDTLGAQLCICHNEVLEVFNQLNDFYHIKHIFSHQETGNKVTFDRDLMVQQFCSEQSIAWHESLTNGVVRKLKSRKNWESRWKETMTRPMVNVDLPKMHFLSLDKAIKSEIIGEVIPVEVTIRNDNFQQGGETFAWKYLRSFLQDRYPNYSKHISKPELSRRSCSRLSPYLTYGNISMRSVYQTTMKRYGTATNKRALTNFISRLHWHCHFIQKFEDECSMEFQHVNSAYDTLVKIRNESHIIAWQTGQTGVPIVDACMRCLVATGYINFRMRAMVVSFFVFNLWQDWRDLHFLARQFLDYEPGIHYPQLHMQSGVTGVNTIRIYNPIKNSIDHDENGHFICRWVPELANIPTSFIHEPWKLSVMEQQLYGFVVGQDYPMPIVDIESSRQKAADIVWNFRKSDDVKQEGKRILAKHTNAKGKFTVHKKNQ